MSPDLESVLRAMSKTPFSTQRSCVTLALLSLAFGAGCSASAEIPEVVVTRTDVAFMGVPVIPGITDVTQTVSTSFDHPSDFELPSELNPELRPLSASVAGNGDMQDLSFLEGMKVTLSSRAEGAPPPRTLAYYERPANGAVGGVVNLQTNVESDVLSYWETKQAYYEVTLWGVLPSEDWAIDVTFAFSGSISVSP
jgi:hypothetical protein